MLTRCPHCQTAFRVTSEQLKVRQGRVRCGACQAVFDALDSLTDELAIAAEVQAAPEPPAVIEPDPDPVVEPPAAIVPLPEPEAEAEAEAEPTAAPEQHEPEQTVALPESATEPEVASADSWVPEEAPPRRWPWVSGVLVLLLLSLGQLLFIFRVELGVLTPELRPMLAAACEPIGCTLPYPSKSELVGIETSDLAPAGNERLLLTATIRNRAPFIQEYPHLELTLTDTRDEPLLRKVLPPAEYLPPGQLPTQGFPARGEAGVRLLLEAPGVPAVGYRLYLFYP